MSKDYHGLLRAKIYDKKNELDSEFADLKRAFAINSSNPNVIDMIAKLALKRGDYATAETNFNAILRMSPQNYDALYGLARVAAKTNDYAKAQEYCDRAVKLFPAEPQVYINRAEVFIMLGQYKVAAQDIILAMSVGNDENKAISALVNMSDEHYDDVMNALQNSIDNAPSVGTFYYLRYSIAMRQLHYSQALRDLKQIISKNIYVRMRLQAIPTATAPSGSMTTPITGMSASAAIRPILRLTVPASGSLTRQLPKPQKALSIRNAPSARRFLKPQRSPQQAAAIPTATAYTLE